MRRKLFICFQLLFFAVPFLLRADERHSQRTGTVTEKQIDDRVIATLIEQLGDDKFTVRERATKKLKEIGIHALNALWEAENNKDPEIRNRAISLVSAINAQHGVAIANGLEFKLNAERIWKIPKSGQATAIGLTVEIKSHLKNQPDFALSGISLVLVDEAGCAARTFAVRSLVGDGPMLSLSRDKICTILFSASLHHLTNERGTSCHFRVDDNRGATWTFIELRPAKYRLHVGYANDTGPLSVWKGSFVSPHLEIQLVAPERTGVAISGVKKPPVSRP